MKRSYRIQDGKILIYQEIELTDHAQYLKFDWHLYNLSKDIDEENDKTRRNICKLQKNNLQMKLQSLNQTNELIYLEIILHSITSMVTLLIG